MAARTPVLVPDIGDFHDVEVIEVLVKAGDTVALEAPLITLETDKATMDVPSTAAGRIAEVSVKKGDRVSKGSPIVVVETAAAAARTRREGPGPGGREDASRSALKLRRRCATLGRRCRTLATSRTSR